MVHRLGLAANTTCPACGEPDSAAHLLTECPAYEVARHHRWGLDPDLRAAEDVLGGPAALVVDFIRAVGRADPRGQPACAAVSPRGGGVRDAGEEAVFSDSKVLSVQYKRMIATISKCICILHTQCTNTLIYRSCSMCLCKHCCNMMTTND